MAWLDTVEDDMALSEGAWKLARAFHSRSVSRGRYASAVLSEVAHELNVTPEVVLKLLQELEDHGHLRRLQYGAGYELHVALMTPDKAA